MKTVITLALAAATFMAAPATAATSISVANASFETLPPGGLPDSCGTGCSFSLDGNIPGWSTSGGVGLFQPGTAGFFNSVPDGLTVAYSNGGTIWQTVGVTAVAGTTYTLSTAFGARNDIGGQGSVSLLVGANTVVATGVAPTAGNWSTFIASYTATLADAGSAITIQLDSRGPQGGFDKVELSAVLPEPANWAMLITGFGLTGAVMRRRRVTAAIA